MKIYTEINYEWLDGQLVKTNSKSFEYDGQLTLCFGGNGGGGGSNPVSNALEAVPTVLSELTENATTTIDDVITDPVGTTTGAITDTVNIAGDNLSDATDLAGDNLQTGLEMTQDNLNAGVEGIGMNEGVATTLGDFGQNISTNMAPLADLGGKVTGQLNQAITDGLGFVGDKANELSTFIHGSSSPSDVTLDPNKFAVKGSKKKKNKSDLAVNKSKTRARKSLRIGK